MYSIDLNSDMGESFGAYKIGGDEEIIKYVTTANVACGWHAGDPMVMDKVVRMAKRERCYGRCTSGISGYDGIRTQKDGFVS